MKGSAWGIADVGSLPCVECVHLLTYFWLRSALGRARLPRKLERLALAETVLVGTTRQRFSDMHFLFQNTAHGRSCLTRG